jgi:hypothetical protein
MEYQEAQKLNDSVAQRLHYIAKLNPKGVNKLAYKYGYPVPKENINSKFNFLALWFYENGNDDKALDELLLTHPDFNLFAETMASKLGVMPRAVSKYSGPLQYEPDEEGLDEDEFGNYDGFIDNNDTYQNDNFIDAIAGAVKGVAGTVGKFAGTGKKGRESQQKWAEEQTKQAQTQVQIAAIEAKKAEKVQKAKTKKIIIISSISAAVVIIGVVLYFVFRKK